MPGHRLLVLGGSTEASALSRAVAQRPGPRPVLSFAGRTAALGPTPPGAEVRVGGFGGVDGLADHLRCGGYAAVVDATHPFARRMPFHAQAACAAVGLALLRLVRPGWSPGPLDRWTDVATVQDAADAVRDAGRAGGARRVLLTIGRQELAPFARCDAAFVVRSIDPPDPTILPRATVLLVRGPFDVDGELAVLRTHAIDLIVSKNSGGSATRAKLDAARLLGIPVVMVARPPAPTVATVATVEDAMAWLDDQLGAP